LPCVQAMDFLADIYEQAGDQDNILKAVEVHSCDSPFLNSE
jgi:hypothetical protein